MNRFNSVPSNFQVPLYMTKNFIQRKIPNGTKGKMLTQQWQSQANMYTSKKKKKYFQRTPLF